MFSMVGMAYFEEWFDGLTMSGGQVAHHERSAWFRTSGLE